MALFYVSSAGRHNFAGSAHSAMHRSTAELRPNHGARFAHLRPLHILCDFHIIESMKPSEAITALSALASEPRLTVYRLLVKRGPKGYTPSELTERLELPAPTLSFHLKGLLQAGLVGSRREGRNLHYRPNFERMNGLVAFLTENCCSLADEICGPTCQPQSASGSRRKTA